MNIGHMMMALSALNLLKAERVIFIPSCNSIDKLDGLERIKMLKLAFKDYDVDKSKFMISPVEIKKEIHEPLDTIIYFKKKYPDMKLLYLLGQDEISSLSSFKGIKEMKKLVKFIYVTRTGYEGYEELISEYQMKKLDIMNMDIKSSDIRSGYHLYTSRSVIDYIADHQLYFCARLFSMMKPKRFYHSVSVAKTAYEIAIRSKCSLDPLECYQAGLFHDCGKNIPLEQQETLTHEFYSQYEPVESFALHQFASCVIAKRDFGIDNEEVLSSICYHCTGRRNMSDMEKLIYAADKVEPTREFETKKSRLACYKNLEKGFITTLKEQEKYFLAHHIAYKEHFLSKEMYEQYLGE